MAIIAKANGDGGGNFQPAPSGVHQAVCVDVVDLGMLDVAWQGKTKRQHKVNVAWQINEDRDDGKPYLVFKRYTLSLHEKAGLRKDLESWRGRKFTRDEEMGFDLESVIGANCLLNITHNQVADKTYANVVSIMPLAKGMPAMAARDFVRKVDREPVANEHHTEQAADYDDAEQPPITADDIPFAWLLPFILPAALALHTLVA
jgi:hypothetical protein